MTTDKPTRWIERAQDVLMLPVNPADWTPELTAEIVARLNCDGLRKAVGAALVQAAGTNDREGQQEGAA